MSERGEALAERLFGALLGAIDIQTVYLGDRLGLYTALAEGGPTTSTELAARAGIAERYAREWLEQQAVGSILDCDDASADEDQRRYTLPPEYAEVLLDPDSRSYLAPTIRMIVAASRQLPALMEAYRTGGGVGWSRYGPDMSEGQEGGNRPFYVHEMGEWIASGLPEVHTRLGEAGAKVADVGCGGGWSSISIARAYPNAEVHGFDLDEPAVERARENAEAAGVADRVTFHSVDPREAGPVHRYDLVTAFECIHDMPHPVPVLATMRAIVDDAGAVMVMDEGVAESFTAPGDDLERLMYGFSTLVCLPDGMAHPNSAGTGTVMRPSTMEAYASEAGFTKTEILPIEAGFWRFYRLHA
ncbi:MAG: class I SAM-dependent methyltransferase [Actinomycetota bacterium]